jgi:hypothetical protein
MSKIRVLIALLLAVVTGLVITAAQPDATAAGPVTTTVTLSPTGDADVNSGSPATNTGTALTMGVLSSPERDGLMQFDLSSIPANATVNDATLSVYVASPQATTTGLKFYTAGTFNEATVTWNTKPTIGTAVIGSVGAAPINAYTTPVHLTNIVGGGPEAIAAKTSDTTLWRFSSKDSTHPPKLVVTYTTGATPPPSSTLPLRGQFFYPWYPESWTSPAPHYTPTLGAPYNQDTAPVVAAQVDQLNYAKTDVAISSWWGQGSKTDSRLQPYLTAAHGTNLKFAPYYECDGNACANTPGAPNPTAAAITSDLNYLAANYIYDPNYLWVAGKPVVFVYNANDTDCGVVDRWQQANTAATQQFYVVLKVFSGYTACANQPNNWHQYGPSSREDVQGSHSISISPGYWKYTDAAATLSRSVSAFTTAVNDMNCAKTDFKLVTTFNEEGEGTGTEPATQWSSASGYGQYLDVLHNNTTCGTPPVNQPPVAAFTSSTSGLTASFNGSGSSDPDGTISSYAWTFGDGTTGSGATVSHTYGRDHATTAERAQGADHHR